MERFREVIWSILPPDDEFQYETYLRESVVHKYSVTIMLHSSLEDIDNDSLAPILLSLIHI